MKLRIIFPVLLVFILSSSSQILAQPLDLPNTILDMPDKYQYPTVDLDTESRNPVTLRGTLWQVYSDRANNPTYREPGGSPNPKLTLDFLDAFFVVAEYKNYLRLVKDPKRKRNKLSSQAIDFGWVPKENLLLWKHCLVTNLQEKINKKAMVLNTKETLKGPEDIVAETDFITFSKDPGFKRQTTKISKLFEVFYIYKIEGNSVLLGNDARITGTEDQVNDIIRGWVPRNRINFWDHRLAIEPNMSKDAIRERKNNLDYMPRIMLDKPTTEKYIQLAPYNQNNVIWENGDKKVRRIGQWRRFPIISNENSLDAHAIMQVGVMGEIRFFDRELKHKSIDTDKNASIQRKYNLERAKVRNINIVFAIDGTRSMKDYFEPVSTAIADIIPRIKSEYSKNTVRFGAVVYRDFAEEKRLCEQTPITADDKEIIKFIQEIDPRDDYDKDIPEAVYYGLDKALRMFPDSQTNVLILVGDAGNHVPSKEIEQEDLLRWMSKKDVSFLSFQVHHESRSKSYDEFVSQSENLIQSLANIDYNKDKILSRSLEISSQRPALVNIDNNRKMLTNSPKIGRIVYADKDSYIDPAIIETEIREIIDATNKMTEDVLSIAARVFDQGDRVIDAIEEEKPPSEYVDTYGPAVRRFINRIGIPQENLDIVKRKRYQMYLPGYTAMQVKGQTHPLFKKVLLLTKEELANLVIDFGKLLNSQDKNQRKAMQNSWLTLLKKNIGGTDEELLNLTMEEINMKVFGIPGSSSSMLRSLRLKDITEKSKLSHDEFGKYRTMIEKKQYNLKRIFNQDNYEYSFMSNDQLYYWILEDLLP